MTTRFAAIIPVLALTAVGAAQTAFTYQGRVKDGTQVATGLYDLRFSLFDSSVGGTQLGTSQCVDNVEVLDGVFTTTIDFGQQFNTPASRFLEIEARADTGLDCSSSNGLVVLAPRQLLTATPRAIHARSAFSLASPDGTPSNALVVGNSGNIGIGATTPQHPLHIANDTPVMILQDTGVASTQSGYLGFWNNASTETGWVGYGTPGGANFSIFNGRVGGHVVLLPAGNVGIGTDVPLAKLDVRGDIRLGSSGQFRATSGEENLRIVRGTVTQTGTIIQGTGFTVTNPATGRYTITFNTPFAATPTVTANSELTANRSYIQTDGVTSAAATLVIFSTNVNSVLNDAFHFIAIGPR